MTGTQPSDSATGQPFRLDTVDLTSTTATTELGAALERTGFVQLVGHGLSDAARAQHREACDRFFALDEATKLGYVHEDPAANRGYRQKGSEALSYSLGRPAAPDLFESFNAGLSEGLAGSHRLLQHTPWPDDRVEGFRAATGRYVGEIVDLIAALDARIGALLSIDWLAARSTRGPDMIAAINYRPNPDGSERSVEGQQRMGAHSDYTTFTLLDADPVAGLQIVGPDQEWVDVCPEPGALLMNVGDVLAMLTNDRWPSTLHRVVPMVAGAAAFRRSVATFHYPDLDVELAPLANFVEDAPRYEPVTVGQHVLSKLIAPKIHEVSTAATTESGRLQ